MHEGGGGGHSSPSRDLAAALRALRAEAGNPSTRRIAEDIGTVSHTTVADALNGKRVPSWRIVAELCRYFGAEAGTLREAWVAAARHEGSGETSEEERDFVASYLARAREFHRGVRTVGRGELVLQRIDRSPIGADDSAIDIGTFEQVIHRSVVLGGPGSGKTTVAHDVAARCAQRGRELPFVVHARDLVANEHLPLVALVRDQMAALFQRDPPDGFVQKLCALGGILLVFDALDELDDDAQRRQLLRVHFFGQEFPKARVLVTSRPMGYAATFFEDNGYSIFEISMRELPDGGWSELQESAARFRSLVQHASDLVVVLDDVATVTYVSPSVVRVLGYLPDEVLDTEAASLVHEDDLAALPRAWQDPFPTFTREIRVRRRNGDWAVVEFTATDLRRELAVGGVVLHGHDVTDRKVLETELRRLALHDGLTGLANRTLFLDRVSQALTRRPAGSLAVLFVDLDDFRTVNDNLGHVAGDMVLRTVAERINGCSANGTVARLGGDEFAILLDDIETADDAVVVARRISEAMSEPFDVDGRRLFITVTVGVAVHSGETVSTEVLLRRADVAMYLGKTRGAGRVQVYDDGMDELFRERLELKGELAGALEQRQFLLVYQPIVSLSSGALTGFEALLRWRHPERGLIPPNVFVPIAEESGDIVAIGQWVLQEACARLAEWDRAYGMPLRMSVDLSTRQLEHPGLVAQVRAAVTESGIDRRQLMLEIPEDALAHDAELVRGQFAELRNLGVRIAVDHFGTGYSSFGYLHQFPVDVLKIDRTFVMDLREPESEEVDIVRAIVALAISRGLGTVAIGIENDVQADVLAQVGCDAGQGYLYSRALHAPEVGSWLQDRVSVTGPDTPRGYARSHGRGGGTP